MILGFESFHPLTGECPNTFPEYGNDIIYRARAILKNRYESEIYNILDAVNWITQHKSVKLIIDNLFDEQLNLIDNDEEIKYKNNLYSLTFAIKCYQNEFTLPKIEVSNLQWHDIYATLALALINKAVDDENHYSEWQDHDEWLHEWRVLSHSSTWIIEAMEAVATADGYKAMLQNQDDTKKKLSSRNSLAAIKRHSATNNAILELTKLYKSGKYKSMRNAAQIYIENHPEKVAHLSHHNQLRTLTEGLSKHLKGSRRSINET